MSWTSAAVRRKSASTTWHFIQNSTCPLKWLFVELYFMLFPFGTWILSWLFFFILPTMISSEGETCPLARINQSYRCDCKITSDKYLSEYDKYVISLCITKSDCHQLTNNFVPHLNSKLDLIKIVVIVSCVLFQKRKERKKVRSQIIYPNVFGKIAFYVCDVICHG